MIYSGKTVELTTDGSSWSADFGWGSAMSISMHLSTPAGTVIGEEALTALSSALFCTSLHPADSAGHDCIRREVLHMLGSDLTGHCQARVAQAAVSHPLGYASRMAWCRQMVLLTFFGFASPRQEEPET